MKKFFMFAAMASVTFASCVKNEPAPSVIDDQVEIAFEAPVLAPNVKSATEFHNDFPTDVKIGVWAYYYVNSTNAELEANYSTFDKGTLYMGSAQGGLPIQYTQLSADPLSGTWKHAVNKYYWPKNGALTFTAYAPYTEANARLANTTKSGVTFTDYVVPADDNSLMEDLLYSERVYDATVANLTNPDRSNAYEGVSLVFKHALSSIRFTLKAAADYNPTTLIVKKIELLNVVSKGSFDQNLADADDATSPKGVWTLSDVKETYTVDLPSTDGITLSSTEVKYANNAQVAAPVSANGKQVTDFILLPQKLNNVQLRVTFTLKNDQMAAPIEQVLTKKLITDTVTEWHEGSRYTYNVAVALDEIYFEPTVTNWVDVNVTDLPNL